MPSLNLKGKQFQALSAALRDAFTLARLTQMLRERLERNLEDIALGDDYEEIAFKLIRTAEAEGWTAELLVAGRAANPRNAKLLEVAQQLGLGASTPALERKVQESAPFLDVVEFRTKLAEIENRVCRVEITTPQGTIFGTGFLLGPQIVMTNYHVMESVIKKAVKPSAVHCRFDYKRLAKAVINGGSVFSLASDWLVDYSPISRIDLLPEPKPDAPDADELDYAIVRVEGTPGSDPIAASAEQGGPPRGWLPVSATPPYEFAAGSPLLIMQHPDGTPLKLALDMSGVIGMNANGTRVKYKVNTEGGSSGSPCFNADWDLVALHHSGDPNFDPDHKPDYNEGIPISAIVALLEQRGKAKEALGPWA